MIFFFKTEDVIRDRSVTGVQTCALPIYRHDRWLIGNRVSDDDRVDSEYGLHIFFGDDFAWMPMREDLPARNCNELIGIACGQIEVVQHHDDGGATIAVELG